MKSLATIIVTHYVQRLLKSRWFNWPKKQERKPTNQDLCIYECQLPACAYLQNPIPKCPRIKKDVWPSSLRRNCLDPWPIRWTPHPQDYVRNVFLVECRIYFVVHVLKLADALTDFRLKLVFLFLYSLGRSSNPFEDRCPSVFYVWTHRQSKFTQWDYCRSSQRLKTDRITS